MQRIFIFLALCCSVGLSAQDLHLSFLSINDSLTRHANAVVREEIVEIEIAAIDKLYIHTKRIVTVLNEHGNRYAFVGDSYDKSSKINNQKAVVYDAMGNEIKVVKKRDFEDRSLVASGTLYNDNRLSYFDYTPRAYPFTIVYESIIEKENTIFLNDWEPVGEHNLSVERSSYSIKNRAGINLRTRENNFEGANISKEGTELEPVYILKDFPAVDYEKLSPSLEKITPRVQVALDRFSLVGVEGSAATWEELGKWQYENLLKDRNELPETTVEKVKKLTAGAKSDVEKAKLIYEYVQENSRYISVQLGIGGWSPAPASEVDQLKYGDCKGLTNYTKALLDSQNIPSYYAVVIAGEEQEDLEPSFASMQGNHVILNLPQAGEDEDVWLECTSQTLPFNYLGDFTDNRNVLLVKPEGGEIVRTKSYSTSENLRESSSRIALNEDGSFSAAIERRSYGVPYGNIYGISTALAKDQELYYKKLLKHLRSLNISKVAFNNDREKQVFTETLNLSGEGYGSKTGKRMLLPLNFFRASTYDLPRLEERRQALEISRGLSFKDHVELRLPEAFELEALPDNFKLQNEFGSFSFTVVETEKEGEQVLVAERFYSINEGTWPAEKYDDFRDFINTINSFSNLKAVIIAAKIHN
ncbi:MAG: DUF3857 and transglutaminase domain-containing protein [Salinimicrobium sediminis]|nr:DUF3857 and transglutaminase domain-containing protein [Salinimicrobium sediminis]